VLKGTGRAPWKTGHSMDFGKPFVFTLGARMVLAGACSCVASVGPFSEAERFLSADCFAPVTADDFSFAAACNA